MLCAHKAVLSAGAEHLRFGDIRMHTSWLPVEEASPAWEPAQVDSDAVAFVGGQSSDSVLDGTLQQGKALSFEPKQLRNLSHELCA